MRRLVFLSLLLVGACKQGEGEYCQVTSDCKDGLVCVTTTMTCGTATGTVIDAAEPDAETVDAEPIDAEPIDSGLPACSDTIDNDDDKMIDFPADPECTSADDDDEAVL